MAITLKKKNFAKSTLNSGISDSAAQLTVASGEGTRFPASGKFRAVLWGASYTNPSDDPNVEIVEAELNAGDVFDITRAKEGTSAQAWSASDNIAHILTAGTLEEIEAELDRPAFSAHKNGTNQNGIQTGVFTKVTFSTEDFDTHGDFDTGTSRFTPSVAGKYLLALACGFAGTVDTAIVECAIYKNGSPDKKGGIIHASTNKGTRAVMSVVVEANGSTDYFEAYIYQDSGFTQTIPGAVAATHFSGCRIA